MANRRRSLPSNTFRTSPSLKAKYEKTPSTAVKPPSPLNLAQGIGARAGDDEPLAVDLAVGAERPVVLEHEASLTTLE